VTGSISQFLNQFERQFGWNFTIIGHRDRLHLGGIPLVPEPWFSHQRQVVCREGFGSQCVSHCRWQVNHRLAKEQKPLVTQCWKGLREIAFPLRYREWHLGTLYVGTWRSSSAPAPTQALSAQWHEKWQGLPLWDQSILEESQYILQALAESLSARLFAVAASHKRSDRVLAIQTWFDHHATMPVELHDLADHLQLSSSRSAAIVREIYHMPFTKVLQKQRIERACEILRATNQSIGDVAHAVGFTDPA
jgi:AraC-like DNA-binding protein